MEFVTKWREDRPDENKSRYVKQICYTDILISDRWFIPLDQWASRRAIRAGTAM